MENETIQAQGLDAAFAQSGCDEDCAVTLHQGDCLEVLRTLPENSIDSLVTDPPAGISFMGKGWDGDKGGRKEWCAWMESVMRECIRVMKPGAHGFVWALPRTSHWTAMALEDAGFEIRDCVYHLFGSGFPKSLDVSKAIDKAAGATRKATIPNPHFANRIANNAWVEHGNGGLKQQPQFLTAPATDAAKQWQGFGTALKPAVECWWLVRKPCSEKTVAANVLKWGCGALNIDASRIGPSKDYGRSAKNAKGTVNAHEGFEGKSFKIAERDGDYASPLGRFPSHLLLSHSPRCTETQCDIECACAQLDAQSGTLKSGARSVGVRKGMGFHGAEGDGGPAIAASSGGASRFFYCAKISSSERGHDNKHPTVKPQKLMRYLARLVTPPGGTMLDPFMGSGSTGLAAKSEGFGFIGIEREQEYFDIAEKRVMQ